MFLQVEQQRSPESGQYYSDKESLLDAYRALVAHIKSVLPAYFEKQVLWVLNI